MKRDPTYRIKNRLLRRLYLIATYPVVLMLIACIATCVGIRDRSLLAAWVTADLEMAALSASVTKSWFGR